MSSSSWFEQLEAQLEQQLEAFLGSHPDQQELLEREELLERQRRLHRRRLQIQAQAEQLRQALLQIAGEITQWQKRVQRAKAAGAQELAARAQAHQGQLMGQGRDRWQQLGELGKEFARVEQDLLELGAAAAAPRAPQVFRPVCRGRCRTAGGGRPRRGLGRFRGAPGAGGAAAPLPACRPLSRSSAPWPFCSRNC